MQRQHLNFVEPLPGSGQHLNLFGISFKKDYSEVDRLKYYQEAKRKYPFDVAKADCESLGILIDNVGLDIRQMEERRASGDSGGDYAERYIDGFTRYKVELEQKKNALQCEARLAEEKEQKFYDTQIEQLQKVKSLSSTAGKTSTIVIFGMIGLVVLVSGIVIYKKLKSE